MFPRVCPVFLHQRRIYPPAIPTLNPARESLFPAPCVLPHPANHASLSFSPISSFTPDARQPPVHPAPRTPACALHDAFVRAGGPVHGSNGGGPVRWRRKRPPRPWRLREEEQLGSSGRPHLSLPSRRSAWIYGGGVDLGLLPPMSCAAVAWRRGQRAAVCDGGIEHRRRQRMRSWRRHGCWWWSGSGSCRWAIILVINAAN